MKIFWMMTLTELKSSFRNIVFIIFTILLPILLILLFGGLYGNDSNSAKAIQLFGGYGAVSSSIPAYLVLALSIITLTGLPLQLVSYKENKVFKRLKGTPIKKYQIFIPILINYLILFLIGMIIMFIMGVVIYDVRLSGNFFAFCLAIIISITATFSIGILISCLCSNVKQVTSIGFTLLIPMIFLSGASMPISAFPDVMGKISKIIPITHCVDFLKNTFLGKPFSDSIVSMITLLVITMICSLLSIKLFKWE